MDVKEARRMNKVLVYRSSLLPNSETFIRSQVLSYRRWHGVLAGAERLPGSNLEGLTTLLLSKNGPGIGNRVFRRIREQMGFVSPSVVAKLKREAAQIAHVHFGTDAVRIWPALRRLNIPVVVTLHGYDINIYKEWWEKGHGGWLRRRYPRQLLTMADDAKVSFIAVSDAIRQRAIEYGIPAEKVSTKYIGVDVSRFTPGGRPILERKRQILYVGRMIEKKGGDILIEAFARVRQRVPGAELVMAGDGPLFEEFKHLARRLNVPVTFMGQVPNNEVKGQIDESRVVCLPSITAGNGDAEGLPIVVLEAQACGVPVVTSARGGATEGIEHGRTGIAFGEKDVDALESALVRLLSDDTLVAHMTELAQAYVRGRFDLRQCTAALEELYDQVLPTQAAALA
jgi:glycosyltransferase involved in cell wall biosynthesis